jgi:hypothetical protein
MCVDSALADPAPVASGWSARGWALHLLEKRRLVTAHVETGHGVSCGPQALGGQRSGINIAFWRAATKNSMLKPPHVRLTNLRPDG